MHLRILALFALSLMMGCLFDSGRSGRRRVAVDAGPGLDGGGLDVGRLPDAGASTCGDGAVTGNEVCDGEFECASNCLSATFRGSITATDRTWARNSSTCTAGSGEYYYDTQAYQWRGGAAALTFHVDWTSVDGYLHVFDGAFDPFNPEAGCLAGDDDEGGTSASAVTVDVQPNTQMDAVLSTYSAGATGDWTLTVTRAF